MDNDRTELFHNLVNLAAVDHKFTEEEIAFLIARADRWGISTDEFETALAGISTGKIQIQTPEDYDARVALMKDMIRLMAADGNLAETEKQMCAHASAAMDFTSIQFGEILEQVLHERD